MKCQRRVLGYYLIIRLFDSISVVCNVRSYNLLYSPYMLQEHTLSNEYVSFVRKRDIHKVLPSRKHYFQGPEYMKVISYIINRRGVQKASVTFRRSLNCFYKNCCLDDLFRLSPKWTGNPSMRSQPIGRLMLSLASDNKDIITINFYNAPDGPVVCLRTKDRLSS